MADEPAGIAKRIAGGYAFSGPALELGSVVLDDTAYPDAKVRIPLGVLNRRGLIAGAAGTGKTKTLQGLAEQLSANGVPVVVADIKGDVSGLAQPGASNDKITARAKDTGDDWQPSAYPVEFLALGELGTGVPVRATITAFGPLLLSKILDLNETQESSLGLVFHYADTAGLPLLDLKDLRALIQFLISNEGKADLDGIGGLSKQTAGVILRELITLMAQIDAAAQQQAVTASSLQPEYGTPIDRESAYEKLSAKLAHAPQADAGDAPAGPQHAAAGEHKDGGGGVVAEVIRSTAVKSFARSAATVLGREITRSIFGTRRR
jgi:hypothetical protein